VVDEDVRDVLGFIPSEILDRTLDALAGRDSRAMLETVGIVADQGFNLQQYVREFISKIRDLLVVKIGLEERILGNPEEKRALALRAEKFSEQDLIRFFDMLIQLENVLRWTSQPRLHLELGFVKLAKVGYVRDIEEIIGELKQGGKQSATPSDPSAAARRFRPPAEEAPPQPQPEAKRDQQTQSDLSFADNFRRRVEEKSPTAAVYLHQADRVEQTTSGIEIVLANSAAYAMLQTKQHKAVLDAVAGELIGKAVSVSLIMKGQQSAEPTVLENAREEPLVKRFLEVFRGDLAQIKPAKGE
jgi:DNA polymerase-3 subunit gamma/tau